jgi:hypothetical protein
MRFIFLCDLVMQHKGADLPIIGAGRSTALLKLFSQKNIQPSSS